MMCVVLLLGILASSFNVKNAKASPRTITVPDDYPKMQEAIDHASDGDTIFVRNGTYYENVTLNKSLSIVGENRDITIIDGCVYVDRVADNVKLFGFTIQGIGICCNSSNNIIQGNCITKTGIGIVSFVGTTNNTIANNLIINNQDGIHAYGVGHIIRGNIIANNTRLGIHTLLAPQRSDRIKIVKNIVVNNWRGINIFGHWNVLSENTIANNTNAGIRLRGFTENNVISDNVITNNLYGVATEFWDNNNVISRNLIQNNTYGLYLKWSEGNAIYHNILIDNLVQAYNYPQDKINTWDNGYPSGGNHWSDYSGVDLYCGPYQNEAGSDGISDTAYTIDANILDHYPLMLPSPRPPGDVNGDGIVDILDIARVAQAFGSTPNTPPWDYWADVNSDNIIDVYDIVVVALHFGETS